jgi:hypothetical protein
MSSKKKKRFIKALFIALAMVLVVYLIYKGYERWPSQNWKEYRSLVRIWPRLKKGKIESITFCIPTTFETTDSLFQEMVEAFGFRTRDTNDIKSWPIIFQVPKENLPECIKIIDKAMKGARPNWVSRKNILWLQRMLIVTDKGKYIVHDIEVNITNKGKSEVHGEEWKSYELGEYLKKCGFLTSDPNKTE